MTRSGADTVVVIDSVHRACQWIGEAMPHDHLAATFLEGGQISVFRLMNELECLAIELFVERKLKVGVEIET
jgi:hypothetical protein